jgi:hypothetical protein
VKRLSVRVEEGEKEKRRMNVGRRWYWNLKKKWSEGMGRERAQGW